MPRVHDFQPSFNAGEFTPRLAARLDFSKYRSALEISENGIPLSEGGWMRRSGSRFIAEEKSSTVSGRLKPFQFSITQAYMLELGNISMRFYRHQAQITVANTDAAITNGQFGSNITDWDDRSTGGAGNQISHDSGNGRLTLETSGTASNDIGWAEQDVTVGAAFDTVEHVLKFRVLGAPGDRVELRIGTATLGEQILTDTLYEVGWHCKAFTPGDGNNTIFIGFRNRGNFRDKDVQIDDVSLIDDSAVEIDTPWPEAALFNVEGPQSADVLYLFNETTSTYKLLRLGHTTWSLVEVPWVDGPYLNENTTATTLEPSATTGLNINLTLSSTTGVNADRGWLSTDIGRLVRFKSASKWGYAVIVSITTTTLAKADVRKDFDGTVAAATWRLGAWSSTTGYAQVGSFFEQRLYAAGTTDQPQTFWASQTADFENFTPDNRDGDNDGTVEADDALNFTLSANDVNAIRWMSAGEDTLVIGTSGGEWVPTSDGEVITPLDITVRRQTPHGSAALQPVRVGNTVLFVQRAKRRVREFGFDDVTQGFRAPDMTRLAAHITKGGRGRSFPSLGIVEMTYAEDPESVVWCVRNDGQLLSMTIRREEDIVGWSRHIIGGGFLNDDSEFSQVWQVDASAETLAGAAQDTDWRDLGTFVNVDRFGGQASDRGEWKDQSGLSPVQGEPNDAATVNGVYAAAEHFGTEDPSLTEFLKATNMQGDDVPTLANIVGIRTRMLAAKTSTQTSRSKTDKMKLVQSDVIGGGNRGSSGTTDWPGPGDGGGTTINSTNHIPSLVEFGFGDTDLWDPPVPWTAALVNSSEFGWALSSLVTGSFSEIVLVDRMQIKVFYTFTAFVDQTINANDTTDANWTVFPATDEIGDYAAFGFPKTFAQIKFDYANGTAGVGGVVVWEYWDGSAWRALSGVVDNTGGFTVATSDGLTVTWTLPTDWTARTINSGRTLFYVRVRITTVYSTNPVLDQGFVQGDEGAAVESVAVIPGANGVGQTQDSSERDEVWIIVKRTINKVTRRYIEMFELDFETGDDQEDAYYVDSFITFDGVAATTLSGYDHLEGETGKVWADGAIQADKKVSSGSITLDTAASVVQFGLGYTHRLKTLKISAGNPAGTTMGKPKRIYGLTFALLNSHTLKFGPSEDNLTEKDFRVVSNPMDAGAPLFTGEQFVEFEGDWLGDARIVIESDAPAPFILLALAPEIQINPLK